MPVQDSNLIGVINENYFIFENKGDFTDSALRSIPYIEYCFRTGYNKGDDNFKTIIKNEMFDLTRKIQTGSKDNELLSSLVVTADGIEAVYKPSGSDDTQFYADATDIPTTITSYNPDIKQFVIEITTNQMSDKLKYNVQYPTEDNLYISSYQIISKENKTLILLTLRDNASGYTADVNRSTDTNQFPYFTLSFGKSPASQLNG
ncbi:hypothetical protein SDC9_147850 [bioreactor metagenome]|uniref:Uncharacterized protein n=1 Tax=bioreactor metagenome TaxID=1076179 RepID=A0A645EIV6_9ZZZZ